jgi:hypothetical protein
MGVRRCSSRVVVGAHELVDGRSSFALVMSCGGGPVSPCGDDRGGHCCRSHWS